MVAAEVRVQRERVIRRFPRKLQFEAFDLILRRAGQGPLQRVTVQGQIERQARLGELGLQRQLGAHRA